VDGRLVGRSFGSTADKTLCCYTYEDLMNTPINFYSTTLEIPATPAIACDLSTNDAERTEQYTVNYHRLSRWLVPSTAEPWPIRLAGWRWMPKHPYPQYCRQRCSPHSRRGRKTDIQTAPGTADSPSRNARTRDMCAMCCRDSPLSPVYPKAVPCMRSSSANRQTPKRYVVVSVPS